MPLKNKELKEESSQKETAPFLSKMREEFAAPHTYIQEKSAGDLYTETKKEQWKKEEYFYGQRTVAPIV